MSWKPRRDRNTKPHRSWLVDHSIIQYPLSSYWRQLRGFAKFKKFQKSKKKLDGAQNQFKLFFLNPLLTWTEHSNHNNQQLLAMCIYRQNTHGILLQNISTGLGLFWEDFPKKKFRVRPRPTHPPTHFHSNLGCLEFFFSLQSP